jgi:tetrahydromethanopterin S-methyltransferase subunit B
VHHTAISPRAIAAETFESECTPAEACDTTGVRLYQVLEARRGEVFERWRAQMSGTLVPSSMPVVELLDHLPHVLDGIIEALRDPRVDTGPLESSPGPEGAAAIHGAQRLRLGFSLDAVVREYGVLREAITRTALESGATIQLSEHEIVANAIVAGSRRRSRSMRGNATRSSRGKRTSTSRSSRTSCGTRSRPRPTPSR